ncbi:MAG: MiaB/RimO family radical SAM methylthiotransferase [Acidimicrobiales bacterium]
MTRRFIVRTFGCQMNEHDSERIAGLLEADGLEATDDLESADVVVLNTCCIRENADEKLYGTLGHLKSLSDRRPDLKIMVGGCLAQKDRDLVRRKAPHVDVVFGTHNVGSAAELLRRADSTGPLVEILDAAEELPSALPSKRRQSHSAWLTIQVGCDNNCAFCIVPSVRGREVSRPFGEIVAEARSLAAAGVLEVTLLGQNVNSYGRDLTLARRRAGPEAPAGPNPEAPAGPNPEATPNLEAAVFDAGSAWVKEGARRARPLFADLLRAVGAVEGIRRVRYTSPHPKDLRQDVMQAMAETPEVCEHLHLPLQSGSDDVLAAMHRGYTAERYLERLEQARRIIPDLAVTTDIIVGFPGETDADFDATLELAATAAYDSAYTFIFSPRPGTEAANRPELFISPEVIAERFRRLEVVVQRSALARHRDRIGRQEEVVVEGPSKRDPSRLTGRTRQNKLVHFDPPATGVPAPGALATVLVTGAAPHHLSGELTEVLTRGRNRIPVNVS